MTASRRPGSGCRSDARASRSAPRPGPPRGRGYGAATKAGQIGMVRMPETRASTGLRLMHVHAHPDDESSKGAATTAKYVAEGVDVHVVTCTGGERGSILNPKHGAAPTCWRTSPRSGARRWTRAREILGVRQDWLGLRRLRLARGRPAAAAARGLLRAGGRRGRRAEPLVRLIRSFRPHVMTTYDENGGYPHPDHIMCHKIVGAAFEAAGDPDALPGRRRAVAAAEALLPPRLPPRAHAGAARGDARAAAWSRRTPSGSRSGSPTRSTTPGSPPGCRARSTSRSATGRCSRTPRRSTPTAPWFAVPARRAPGGLADRGLRAGASLVETELPEDDLFAGLR